MTSIERDLKEIGRFVPWFFGTLGVVVAALPFADRLMSALPPLLRHRDIATVLASIAAYALIGSHVLSKRRAFRVEETLPTGLATVAVGLLLAFVYIILGDHLVGRAYTTSPLVDVILTLWYVSIYSALTLGLWQMAWRAYKTKDRDIDLGWFE